MKLFSKERALYLVDNPTKIGFSWWFFFAGIAAGYALHKHFGDNYFVIAVVEKYVFLAVFLSLGVIRNWVTKRIKTGVIFRDSTLLYLILPAGYVGTLFSTIWASHFIFAVFIE